MDPSRPRVIIYLILALVLKVLQISKELHTTNVTYLDSRNTSKKITKVICALPSANTRYNVPLNSRLKAGKRFLFDFLGILEKLAKEKRRRRIWQPLFVDV